MTLTKPNNLLLQSLSIQCRTFSTSATNWNLLRRRRGPAVSRAYAGYDVEKLDEYKFDDMTSAGQEILSAQREVRKYLRKAKYELPHLKKFAEAFNPPAEKQILRFQREYLIGEKSPIKKKVKLTFSLSDLITHANLTPVQAHKFILLCGTHYNLPKWTTKFNKDEFPYQGELKFVCEKFPYHAQNKKYLSDLLDRLIKEAKDETDTFEDIPIDLRHIKKRKPKLCYPKEWLPKVLKS
ncbi:11923_t:CDS:2 [Ambispora gerdemannii]|uniref:11923_t:CDS:1 n=1 Tax=Ambispora gerdemannii TaxID=144530 RepID=A0A9N9A0Q4_9GLOM|nr:11923_t:CDS:2 [Ambispora gerdemannii]